MTPDGFNIDCFYTVDSTQTQALAFLKSALTSGQDASGHVVMAHHQTMGRGRDGRVWETPPAGNLASTLIWRSGQGGDHGARAHPPGDYSLIVAVALADTIASYVNVKSDISIKWPNDILIKGAKISGILIEHPEPGWLLIGTGVNLAHAPDGRARLYDFCDLPGPTPRDFLNTYLNCFKEWTTIYSRDGLGPICDTWMAQAFGVNAPMTVRLPNDEFSATFRGLDRTDGACLAERADGSIRRVLSGEVFFK